MPWKGARDGKQGHHELPKSIQKQATGHIYNENVIRISPTDHQKIHKDIKEVGPIGGLTRQVRRGIERDYKGPF